MLAKNKVVIKQIEEKPIAAEIIAQSIVDIADGMKRLNASRLSRKAIVALIHDQSRLGKTQIEMVLNNLEELEETWLKKKV